uniref:Uncharacterized protein n=1 Tax=Anguilla anguilla TaxID=7936 RepID=A0A0E9W4Q0_ANGAN
MAHSQPCKDMNLLGACFICSTKHFPGVLFSNSELFMF